MIIRNIELEATVFNGKQLREYKNNSPKIVCIGRSNVGKSSLINKLVNRKNLAKTSSKPGKTVSINYYKVNDSFLLVDLPGYGYAKISKKEGERVRRLISDFFRTADNVKLLMILIDSRRGFGEVDLEVMEELVDKGFPILTVLTKSDKLKNTALKNQVNKLYEEYGLVSLPFTIRSETNRDELLNYIKKAL